jgi:hypothetical protein
LYKEHLEETAELGQSKELVKRKNNMRGEEKNTDMYNHLHSRACIHFSFIAIYSLLSAEPGKR